MYKNLILQPCQKTTDHLHTHIFTQTQTAQGEKGSLSLPQGSQRFPGLSEQGCARKIKRLEKTQQLKQKATLALCESQR